MRTEGIPAQQLWKVLLGREPVLRVWEDNEATVKIVRSGRFPTMRHVKRVHGVSIMSLHDSYHKQLFALEDCHTDVQAADIFTTHFVQAPEWEHREELIGIVPNARLPAARPPTESADDSKRKTKKKGRVVVSVAAAFAV